MPLDHYVTLGRSGLRVSPFCLGAMTFGEELGWGSSVEESEAVLDRYLELGGNFIDTANAYTKGHSEKIIGDHLTHDREKRDRLVIATKFSTNLYVGDPNGGGSNRKSFIAACEQSLRRLRTDYIDLYWLHNWDKLTSIGETMAALENLVQSGKVRAEEMKAHANSFDLILNTVAASHNLDAFAGLLKLDGTMTLVGVPAHPHPSPSIGNLIFERRRIAETQEMLDFCAAKGIVADIELIPARKINESYDRMLRSDVKYRFVIDNSTLKTE